MRNELMRSLSAADARIQYDAQVKKVLSQKIILAWILRRTVDGFKNLKTEEIIPCIEGEPEVSSIAVNPGETGTEQISGMPGEDKVPGEGAVYYDIRFFAYRPDKKERIKILLDVEAQKNFWPGYRIETRGIFYACRMISSQLGPEFSVPDYDGIKKAVSIWICMNAGKKAGNAISEYRIRKRDLISGIPDIPEAYDKISVVLVTLNRKKETKDQTLRMLNTLLSPEKGAAEKKKELEKDFRISMEGKAGKEMELMCNLSGYVFEQGLEKGLERGLRETAERMLRSGRFTCEEIVLSTGLSEEMVRRIEEELMVQA